MEWVDSFFESTRKKVNLVVNTRIFHLIILNRGSVLFLDTEWLVYLAGWVSPAECVLH